MGKEFGYAMLLILTIIFLCRPLQPGWNSLDILKIFPRYFLFLPLPLACSYSASPKYVCHMWGVLRPRLKMCTWVCMCTWMCSQCILLERGMRGGEYLCVYLAEVSISKPKSRPFVFGRPEHRSSLSPPDVCEGQVDTSLPDTAPAV